MAPRRWFALLLFSVFALANCGSPAEPGTVEGYLPACYGPGPDLNLTPTRVVIASQNGKAVTSQAFRSDREHQHYELRLPPGRYELAVAGLPPVQARIRSGERTTADLPVSACL